MGCNQNEIVRCGECGFVDAGNCENGKKWCEMNARYVLPEEFCSWGESMMKTHTIEGVGTLRLKPVDMEDIPQRLNGDANQGRQSKFSIYADIIDEFMDSDCDACEVHGIIGETGSAINKVACSIRSYTKCAGIPMTVTQRAKRVFFVKGCDEED